jgi:hypothetical protein
VAGRFTEPVDATRGVLQSVGIEELHEEGILIEATAGPPGLASFVPPGVGRALRAELDRADRLAFLGAMVADRPSGRVGNHLVRYRLARRRVPRRQPDRRPGYDHAASAPPSIHRHAHTDMR